MSWLPLTELLLKVDPRSVTNQPPLSLEQLQQQALRLAGGLRQRGVRNLAVHLEDAAQLAIALFGAWRAGARVLLPADLQPASRARLTPHVELWLTDQPGDCSLTDLLAAPLAPAELDPELLGLTLCTSGSSGEPKLIDKHLYQLANEVEALEALWGADLGDAAVNGSVATQHIYGLLFRLLWPLCAGRPLLRRALPFAEDMQLASRAQPTFYWVASPALLKRMGDNLDWPALRQVRPSVSAQYADRVAFAAGAMVASFVFFFGLGYGARSLVPWFARPSAWRILDLVVGTTMLIIAVSLLMG